MPKFTIRAGYTIAAATLLGAFLAAAPLQASRAAPVAAPAHAVTAQDKRAIDRSEARIKELHDRLHITAAQQTPWDEFAQTMRDNATGHRASMAERRSHHETMTAVDDFKSFETIAEEHADGMKKLVPSFEALYAVLTPDQQKQADNIFREHRHRTRF
jgi:protein CpxP